MVVAISVSKSTAYVSSESPTTWVADLDKRRGNASEEE